MIKCIVRTACAVAITTLGACSSGEGVSGPIFSDSVSASEAIGFASTANDWTSGIVSVMDASGPYVPALSLPVPWSASERPEHGSFARSPEFMGAHGGAVPAIDWRAPGSLSGLIASPPEGCTVTARGTYEGVAGFVDINQNGVPDDLYVHQECIYSNSSADTTFVDHSVTAMQVKENTSSQYGYDETYTTQFTTTDNHGNTWAGSSVRLVQNLDRRTTGVTLGGDFSARQWTDVAGVHWEDTFGEELDARFAPVGGIVSPPGHLPNGALSVVARVFRVSTDGQNLSFALSTPTPLGYSTTCDPLTTAARFQSGVLVGVLNGRAGGATFSNTYAGCAVATSYTGTKG